MRTRILTCIICLVFFILLSFQLKILEHYQFWISFLLSCMIVPLFFIKTKFKDLAIGVSLGGLLYLLGLIVLTIVLSNTLI